MAPPSAIRRPRAPGSSRAQGVHQLLVPCKQSCWRSQLDASVFECPLAEGLARYLEGIPQGLSWGPWQGPSAFASKKALKAPWGRSQCLRCLAAGTKVTLACPHPRLKASLQAAQGPREWQPHLPQIRSRPLQSAPKGAMAPLKAGTQTHTCLTRARAPPVACKAGAVPPAVGSCGSSSLRCEADSHPPTAGAQQLHAHCEEGDPLQRPHSPCARSNCCVWPQMRQQHPKLWPGEFVIYAIAGQQALHHQCSSPVGSLPPLIHTSVCPPPSRQTEVCMGGDRLLTGEPYWWCG